MQVICNMYIGPLYDLDEIGHKYAEIYLGKLIDISANKYNYWNIDKYWEITLKNTVNIYDVCHIYHELEEIYNEAKSINCHVYGDVICIDGKYIMQYACDEKEIYFEKATIEN